MRIGLGINLGSTSAAGTTLDSLKAILDGNSDASIHDFTQATLVGGTTFTAADLSSNGNDYTQSNAINRPGISASLGATLDGNDTMLRTIAGGNYSVVMTLTKGVSTDGTILCDQALTVALRYWSGVTVLTYSNLTVNEVAAANSDELFVALDGQGERVLAYHAAPFTGDTQLNIGRNSSGLVGSVRRAVIIPESQITGADLTAARTLAAEWVAQ